MVVGSVGKVFARWPGSTLEAEPHPFNCLRVALIDLPCVDA